jgi:phage protein D
MEVMTLAQESRQQAGFYVPQFQVRIQGADLPQNVLRDVLQLTYKDNIKEIDSFEMTVNNWDPATNDFKYAGSALETLQSLLWPTMLGPRFRLFEPCDKQVEIRMGYTGELTVMMTGNFTTMEPNFTSGGAPTLTVRGLNVLHQLRRKQYTYAWLKLTDSEIAENLATLRDNGRKRFPLPIVVNPPTGDKKEQSIPIVSQKQQYDIDFLFSRARQRGYVVYVQEADKVRPKQLYFGPPDADVPGQRQVTFRLEWGKSLIDFKPALTTANQVRSVTVNGWDRTRRKPISATVTLDDRRLNRNRDLHKLLDRCDPREEVVVEEPVFNTTQADKRALALLQERQREMVKATGTTVGLPDLRAGQRIEIRGLGLRFSGTYFVTETTHTIGAAGYTTRFGARREDEGQGGTT